ncbi:tRNA methyltransferase [Candidatus Woesearchaeota archaeon]|nr:MAG: tRNA methyltransferase [Candidatus Woesearchaeota archaeon]
MHKLKPFPDAEKYEFKEKFIERYSKLTDWNTYKKYTLSFLRKSIRINTLKATIKEVISRLQKNWILEQIPWCKEGYWLEHKKGRLDIGNTLEHTLGYYYVQEAASMIPPIVLDPKENDVVLDMCASPGSKTTQLAQYMNNKGLIIANDIKGDRLAALGINLQRMGVYNTAVTLMQGQNYEKTGMIFDKILLDAPCSGTGTIRKSVKTIRMWNPDTIKRIAGLQRKLTRTAWKILKKGGTLVYSTCSTEPEENEAIINWLLENNKDAKIEEIKLNIKKSPPILSFGNKKYNPEISKCLRIWPQDNDTEGFFVAKIKKI